MSLVLLAFVSAFLNHCLSFVLINQNFILKLKIQINFIQNTRLPGNNCLFCYHFSSILEIFIKTKPTKTMKRLKLCAVKVVFKTSDRLKHCCHFKCLFLKAYVQNPLINLQVEDTQSPKMVR